ncbi:MAG: beta-lactamase family protein [Rubrivivax sp.]|nr:beta-lactamase family protein [Rubrivivax sp.]
MTSSRLHPRRRVLRAAAAASLCTAAALVGCGGGEDRAQRRAAIADGLSVCLRALAGRYPALPGIVVHVLDERSGLSWGGSFGLADRATGRALAPDATFRTASVTKTFTAAAILQLHARGELASADAIERHLSAPTLALLRAGGYDTARITIDHLLTHRSGLPDHALAEPYLQAVLADPTHRWARTEQLAVAMSLGPPLFAPGSGWRYSDAGYLLLGEIVERRTGEALGPAFRRLLQLESLRLASTYQESVEPVPAGAGPRARQELLPGVDDAMIDASTDLWGAGGLVSDARDLALFVRALVDGRILEPGARQFMLRVAAEVADATPPAGYARGIQRVQVAGTACWGHDGFSGAFMLHGPALGITVAGSINATEFVGAPPSMAVAVELLRRVAALG